MGVGLELVEVSSEASVRRLPDCFPDLVNVDRLGFPSISDEDFRIAVLEVEHVVVWRVYDKTTRMVNKSKLPVIARAVHIFARANTDLSQAFAEV